MTTLSRLSLSFMIVFGYILYPFIPIQPDAGPGSSSMDFSLNFIIPRIKVLGGKLFLCEDAACKSSTEMTKENYAVYSRDIFDCDGFLRCYGYGFSLNSKSFYKLEIQFEDSIRESDPFYKNAYNARFRVDVYTNKLVVHEISPNSFYSGWHYFAFFPLLFFTLLVEILTGVIYSWLSKTKISFIWLANLISFPIIWFVFPLIPIPTRIIVIVAEIFAVIIEAFILFGMNRKKGVSLKRASLVSLIINGASIGLGFGILELLPLLIKP